jgi:hypothetical protein
MPWFVHVLSQTNSLCSQKHRRNEGASFHRLDVYDGGVTSGLPTLFHTVFFIAFLSYLFAIKLHTPLLAGCLEVVFEIAFILVWWYLLASRIVNQSSNQF